MEPRFSTERENLNLSSKGTMSTLSSISGLAEAHRDTVNQSGHSRKSKHPIGLIRRNKMDTAARSTALTGQFRTPIHT